MLDNSIQVSVRIQPPQSPAAIKLSDHELQLGKHTFRFDYVFESSETQQAVFQRVGAKLVANCLQGYNGCVFVYGQTGSGKTYTMSGSGRCRGLMQNSFSYLEAELATRQSTISCSFCEVYNEQIFDLVNEKLIQLDSVQGKKVNIREDIKKGPYLYGVLEESVTGADQLQAILQRGTKNRHIGETMMNKESSRSHAIFSVDVHLKIKDVEIETIRRSKLNFVDLAGSQKQKSTQAAGQRLKQASSINKSLTTLGTVINSLSSNKNKLHIPYRDSKLTFLLRDSLGGNAKTFLIATVSSNPDSFQQSLSTLKFAERVKLIKAKAEINEQCASRSVEGLQQEVIRLKRTLSETQQRVQEFSKQVKCPHLELLAEYQNKIEHLAVLLSQGEIDGRTELKIQDICRLRKLLEGKDTQDNSQQIEKLKSEVFSLTQQNTELHFRYRQLEADQAGLREALKKKQLQDQIRAECEAPLLEQWRIELETQQEPYQTHLKLVNALQNNNRQLNTKISNYDEQINTIRCEFSRTQEQLLRIKLQNGILEEQIRVSKPEKDALLQQNLSLRNRIKQLEQTNHVAQSKSLHKTTEASRRLQLLQVSYDQLASQNSTLEQSLTYYQQFYKKQIVQLIEQKEKLKEQLEKLTVHCREVEAQLDEYEQAHKSIEQELEGMVGTKKNIIDAANKKLASAKERIIQLQSNNVNLTEKLQVAEKQRQRDKASIRVLETKLLDKQAYAQSILSQFSSQQIRYQNIIMEIQRKLQLKESQRQHRLKQAEAEFEQERNWFKKQIENYKQDITHLIADGKFEMTKANGQIQELQSKFQILKGQNLDLKKFIDKYRRQNSEKKSQVQQVKRLKEKLKQTEQNLEKMSFKALQLQEQLKNYNGLADAYRTGIQNLNKKYKNQNKSLESELNKQINLNSKLTEQLKTRQSASFYSQDSDKKIQTLLELSQVSPRESIQVLIDKVDLYERTFSSIRQNLKALTSPGIESPNSGSKSKARLHSLLYNSGMPMDGPGIAQTICKVMGILKDREEEVERQKQQLISANSETVKRVFDK